MLEEVRREIRVGNIIPAGQAHPSDSPTTSPAKKRGRPKTDHGKLRDIFSELYKKETGDARAPWGGACAGQLRNDLVRLGAEKLEVPALAIRKSSKPYAELLLLEPAPFLARGREGD